MTEPAHRQRIEGALHRSLPATLSIRAAAEGEADDGLLRLRLTVSSETPYLRASWFDDPWIEVLGHKAGEVDLDRLNGGAAVLANHDRYAPVGNTPLSGIGAVERAWLEGGRLHSDLVISRREALADLRQDITDGLVRNVSIGYQINERTLTRANKDGAPNEYRVTSWTPFEISLVDIPADASVGLGRQHEPATPGRQTNYRVIDLPPAGQAGHPPAKELKMTEAVNTTAPAAPTAPAPETRAADIRVVDDALAAERIRVREISALGKQWNEADLAERAIEAGTSLDGFRNQILSRLKDHGALRPSETPEIGLSEREIKSFSFCRALLAAADPHHAAKLAPFELECSRAAQDRRGDSRDKTREAAITIPVDVLNRGIALGDDVAMSVAMRLIARAKTGAHDAYRDLVANTAGAGGNLVATELLGSSFIELFRNALVLDRMGITMLRDLNGNIAIPSHTGTATGYWVAENSAPTESQQTVGQVTLTPKTVGAFTDYSRRLLLQSSIDVEAFVRADLAAIIAQTVQAAAINGSGSSNQPTGLLNISGIGAVAGGTNGAAPTYDHMVDLETAIGNANAEIGTMAYLTNTKVRGKLRKTQEFASTNGKAVWTSGAERGLGDVLGYNAYVTNSVPSDLTKGTSSGVCSAVIMGVWSEFILGMWGGLDVMLDPYTGSTAGTKRVVALQDLDFNVRHAAAFAAMKDALTT